MSYEEPATTAHDYLSTGLNLERARGPEARNLAVGPALFASSGPGWPAPIWLPVLHSTFFSETVLMTFFKVTFHEFKKKKKRMILNSLSSETFKAYTLGSMSYIENFL